MSKMVAIACLFLSMTAYAGYDEGLSAYNKKDFATALKEMEPLASQGNAFAQKILGNMYADGHGVPQDYKEAVKWYRLAADQGYALAQYNLGIMYSYGRGVPQDYKEATKWYRLAADQGDADAQYNLGIMQYNLGIMYSYGHGVPQDHEEAAKWFKEAVKWLRLAADQSDSDAQGLVDKAKKQLSIIEAQEAQEAKQAEESARQVAINEKEAARLEAIRKKEEAKNNADFRKIVIAFRRNVNAGDDSHCGLVIEVKRPLVKIQTMVGEHWLKIVQTYPAGMASCNFINGVYQDPLGLPL